MRPQSVSRTTTGASTLMLDTYSCGATLVYQVVISGTSATYDIQGSLDGVNFENIDAAKTTGMLASLGYVPLYFRLNVSAISAATVTLTVVQNG